ncbi:hybrid sensor histidine kinase/response regulator [Cupriavidus plantarum]|uniref:hybrid sensor histidine kinase/response regulator n=1 Tax=Cupriavidus plantarum TaxID=942865 RepID=UPI001B086716|nr:response regulator [Cupriavidus plantarum]CAG2128283.1 Sensor histidine kinase RcsC [Cupriavidus plantarum]SMR66536.1 PAS/PAC sensor hybrid histidine kinase [Cupriavidus plantarum]
MGTEPMHPAMSAISPASATPPDADREAAPMVLVVDDNPVTRYATVRTLSAAGFRTIEAESGQEALQRADVTVSAIVLDVNLPDIDGFQVCRMLRDRPDTATVPVVHLSATYVQDYDKVRGLDAGASAYLIHPAEPAVLVATISSLLRASAAERSLRESESRFRAIYHQAIGGICTIDLDGRFVDINPAMQRLLRRPPEELVGQPVMSFAPPAWRERVQEATGPHANQGWQGAFPLLDAEGQLTFFEWSISAVLETGVKVAVASNITDRVNLEQQREQLIEREQAARAAVERLNRMKDDFIAILSHELRNPLNVISVWTHVLGRHIDSDEGRRGLAAVERNIAIQRRLVADLVDVSMLNVGKMKLERERTNPGDVIRSAIESMQASAAERRVTLDLEVAPGLANEAFIDPARFQQILWNLLSNAIKFSPEGGVVRVTARGEGDAMQVAVVDQGRGISAEFLPLLFDRFTQSDDANRRKHGGLGLGLAIVKHLAEMHGGSVLARSAGENQGSTFEVTIPLHDTARGADADAARKQPALTEQPVPLHALDILVVEDDADAATALSTILTSYGARVRCARDCDEALAHIHQATPDLVISDIGLPGRDGNDLIRDIRIRETLESLPRVPAIALTAFTRQQDRRVALESGFDAVCGKPLRLQDLLGAIEATLGPGHG